MRTFGPWHGVDMRLLRWVNSACVEKDLVYLVAKRPRSFGTGLAGWIGFVWIDEFVLNYIIAPHCDASLRALRNLLDAAKVLGL